MTLPSAQRYGFVRLVNRSGVWAADPDYVVNVNVPQHLRPLAASISGPSYLPNYNGTWTASVSGGQPAYTYLWEYQLECSGGARDAGGSTTNNPRGGVGTNDVNCDEWYYGGTQASFTRTFWQNANLRLTVRDAANGSAVSSKYISVPGGGGGAFASQAATSQEALAKQDMPVAYALRAAQPNPFASSTLIQYDLPEATYVRLTVYDMTGREVARLVDEEKGAGYHAASFDAKGISSGVYLYRLNAGAFKQTGRLVLLK